jgi:hypothetical protein
MFKIISRNKKISLEVFQMLCKNAEVDFIGRNGKNIVINCKSTLLTNCCTLFAYNWVCPDY